MTARPGNAQRLHPENRFDTGRAENAPGVAVAVGLRPDPVHSVRIRPAPRRPGRPGGPLAALAAGLSLLAAGVVLALERAGSMDLGSRAAPVVWASAAAILGVSIIAAGVTGRNTGLLSFLAVAALISAILSWGPGAPGTTGGRAATWAPVSLGVLHEGYSIAAGSGEVDLRALREEAPLSAAASLRVEAAASRVSVLLPEGIPVRVAVSSAFGGSVRVEDGEGSAAAGGGTRLYNAGAPGEPLILEVRGVLSTITITAPGIDRP
jgi:hypothetical protein